MDVQYDCAVVCLDRHSGWIIAKPTQHVGLTAEKCAHLLLNDSWDQFGIPAIITSDQGPQFVGPWFQTMCSRLGILQSYSQAHRPQANGRSEAAGKQIFHKLRHLNAEKAINWVEALPRALRFIHDQEGPGGLSPYRILMGRDRPLQGIPYSVPRQCLDANEYFDHIDWLDKEVSATINDAHYKEQERHNRSIRPRPKFEVGDIVWHTKPAQLGGHKLQTQWVGPCTIISRKGKDSYIISGYKDVHISQLKPCVSDALTGDHVPLHYFKPQGQRLEPTPILESISDHRVLEDGTIEFKAQWVNSPESMDSWITLDELIVRRDMVFHDYFAAHGLESFPVRAIGKASTVTPSH